MPLPAGSKFKHLGGSEFKREEWYPDLAPSTTNDAHLLAASCKHLAVVWASGGGGGVGCIAIDQPGKRQRPVPVIHAHGKQIYDIGFSPFDDNLLCTSSDDSTLKLWKLPERGLQGDMSRPQQTLSGHGRRVETFAFHPTAAGVLASGSVDRTVKVWDVEQKTPQLTLEGHGDRVHSLSWDHQGSLLASSCGDKTLRIWDPRKGSVALSAASHQGVKASLISWMGSLQQIISSGFSKTRSRELYVWDARSLTKPLASSTIDSSTGVLIPFYDKDSQVLLLAGKGDASVKYFDMRTSSPYFSQLGTLVTDNPQRDVAIAPKRGVSVMDQEVVRLYKLAANTASVVPMRFVVPRKFKGEFDPALFPETASAEPGQTAEDWLQGQNVDPKMMSLDPAKRTDGLQAAVAAPGSSTGLLKAEEATAPASPAYVPREVSVVRSSKYRHIKGRLWKKELFITNLKVTSSSTDISSFQMNTKYIALPWVGSGGRIAIVPSNHAGKVPDDFAMIETKASTVVDFSFSPFDDSLIGHAGDDGTVAVWKIPSEPLINLHKSKCVTTPVVRFSGHSRKVYSADFHPTANNILVTTSMDGTVKLWDVVQGKDRATCNVINELVQSVSFSHDGSQIATSTKDKQLKVFDPRTNTVAASVTAHDGAKGFKLTWMGSRNKICSTGFSKAGREMKIWDPRNLGTHLSRATLENASGIINPTYDDDTGVVFLVGRGDGDISYYELTDEDNGIHLLSKFQTSDPQLDVAWLPKQFCNIKDVEVQRAMKLTPAGLQPISFTVPRTRKEFFQDDIYPLTRDVTTPALDADAFFSGKNAQPKMIDLRPSGMELLSNAPVITREKKYHFDPNAEPELDLMDKQKAVMDKFWTTMQDNKEDEDQPEERVEGECAADDEWSD